MARPDELKFSATRTNAPGEPTDWKPSILKSPELLTEADVVEAEAELRASNVMLLS
jgi:hypothetical protein